MNETTSTEITFIHSPDMTEMATVITGENPMPLLRLTRRLDAWFAQIKPAPDDLDQAAADAHIDAQIACVCREANEAGLGEEFMAYVALRCGACSPNGSERAKALLIARAATYKQ